MNDNMYNIPEFDCATILKSELDDQPEELEVHYSAPGDDSLVADEHCTTTQQTIGDMDLNYRKRRAAAKRKLPYDDPRVSSLCKIARKLSNDYEKRDECKVFGEYLVFKLRNYDFRTRSIVQHLMNNIIFNADMGKYSKSETSKMENNSKTCDSVSVLNDKTVSQDIDYLQEISKIVSDGKHFLDI